MTQRKGVNKCFTTHTWQFLSTFEHLAAAKDARSQCCASVWTAVSLLRASELSLIAQLSCVWVKHQSEVSSRLLKQAVSCSSQLGLQNSNYCTLSISTLSACPSTHCTVPHTIFKLSAGRLPSRKMLSTAQALKGWEQALKLLSQIKAHAAAGLPGVPQNCDQIDVDSLSGDMASPAVTWKQLLKKQVNIQGPCRALNLVGLANLATIQVPTSWQTSQKLLDRGSRSRAWAGSHIACAVVKVKLLQVLWC